MINYIYSPNGTGKTNLLEAIQCLTVGKSLRSSSESELVDINTDITDLEKSTIYISGEFGDNEGINFNQTYSLQTSPKKQKVLLVNKNKTSFNNFLGRVPSIWFSPESIKIINSSPLNKRKYFDDILIQLYPEYNFDLKNYNKALRQRNKLLQEPDNLRPNSVRIWTEQLIKYGCKIIKSRLHFFDLLNQEFSHLDDIHRYKFHIEFEPNVKINHIFDEDVEYKFREELRHSYKNDLRNRSTTIGPHRDDWHMMIAIEKEERKEKKEESEKSSENTQSQFSNSQILKFTDSPFIRADKFASRGQQRMALIMLQMILVRIFEKNIDKKPILLLDDIFSELDEENEKILIEFIEHNKLQSFITGVEKKGFKNIEEINLIESK